MRADNKIKQSLVEVLEGLDLPTSNIELDQSSDLKYGDYTTNVAMRLAKREGKNPTELASEIVKSLVAKLSPHTIVEKDDMVAGPGFINITLAPEVVINDIKSIDESYGANKSLAGKNILIEHSSPNLFKPFHIGHVMNNAVGEAVTRLLRFSGANVTVISYPSDVSLGIGKSVWALLENGLENLNDDSISEIEKLKLLGAAYVKGTNAYDNDETAKSSIKEITQEIYSQEPGVAWDIYNKGKDINLSYFKRITERLGSEFDGLVFESEVGPIGKKIVLENLGNIFTKSDGAVIYEGEKDGLHTRVFINSGGNPTYEAKDVGLLNLKFANYSPDISVFVTDHEQGPYFKVVSKAAGKINPEWEEKTVHLVHGRMQFKGMKMSSRLGGVPLAADILEVLLEEVSERSEGRDIPSKTMDAIAIAALKFAILRSEAGKNINFDPDKSLSFEGDSGPYLQYTYARTQSLLRKGSEAGITPDFSTIQNTENVDRMMIHFSEVVEKSQQKYAPHNIAGYAIELSREFNSWYARERILDGDNPQIALARVKAVGHVIKNALYLLGIDAPDRM